jgi:hypothetical protein
MLVPRPGAMSGGDGLIWPRLRVSSRGPAFRRLWGTPTYHSNATRRVAQVPFRCTALKRARGVAGAIPSRGVSGMTCHSSKPCMTGASPMTSRPPGGVPILPDPSTEFLLSAVEWAQDGIPPLRFTGNGEATDGPLPRDRSPIISCRMRPIDRHEAGRPRPAGPAGPATPLLGAAARRGCSARLLRCRWARRGSRQPHREGPSRRHDGEWLTGH